MTLFERADHIVRALETRYPDATCALTYEKDYELLFSVRLAAQCTDARVNIVTQTLFRTYPTLQSFAEADLPALEEAVRPCGFFRLKARDIRASARMLLEAFDGCVPDTMENLLRLPGVGRKTANLILGDVYDKGGIVVDTHCMRIANLLGLCHEKDPHKVERALDPLIPKEAQSAFCHRLVWHGRDTCIARRPRCGNCVLQAHCDFFHRSA
ncbi:MAG: endonuclease III [Oscillospiraceae bacterium]|jgi:endonuclease-3|nr:endonuclease III [Oscillospiraceae bacterium]